MWIMTDDMCLRIREGLLPLQGEDYHTHRYPGRCPGLRVTLPFQGEVNTTLSASVSRGRFQGEMNTTLSASVSHGCLQGEENTTFSASVSHGPLSGRNEYNPLQSGDNEGKTA